MLYLTICQATRRAGRGQFRCSVRRNTGLCSFSARALTVTIPSGRSPMDGNLVFHRTEHVTLANPGRGGQQAPEAYVLAFLESAGNCVKATWLWQTLSQRYKFRHSIFAENRVRAGDA
jgi:hypothetical protein